MPTCTILSMVTCRRYFSTIPSAKKEQQGAKMTQVECIHSMHSNLLPDKSMLCQSDGHVTRPGASHRSFRLSAVLDSSYTGGTPLYAT